VSHDKKEILARVVSFAGPIKELRKEASLLEFDSEEAIAFVAASDIISVLKRFLRNELAIDDVEEWANLLEMRDDIGIDNFKRDSVRQAIHVLANPVLEGFLTTDMARSLISALEDAG
jgi:hypothetical protein